ncbi:MAG: hypothetical protein WC294_00165 [Methanoregula sp.]
MAEMKVCLKCGLEKGLDRFSKDSRLKQGLRYCCKECDKKVSFTNAEQIKKTSRDWYLNNKERRSETVKNWKAENVEKVKEDQKRWLIENLDRSNEVKRKWYADNKERILSVKKVWISKNIEKERERQKRIRSTPRGRLSKCVGGSMRNSLKARKAGRHWEDLVGYSLDDLMRHLEKQFKPEMNWDNHGSYWHIDHKIPIAAFNYETPDDIDFKRCWSLKNLQPLWYVDNIRKSDNLEKPFQPSLALAEVANGR